MSTMKTSLRFLLLLALGSIPLSHAEIDANLAIVESLGRLNGQALACGESQIAARAKELMLKHAPRTAQYGNTFEQATQKGFLELVQTKDTCPSSGNLSSRMDMVATVLKDKLPPAGEPAK